MQDAVRSDARRRRLHYQFRLTVGARGSFAPGCRHRSHWWRSRTIQHAVRRIAHDTAKPLPVRSSAVACAIVCGGTVRHNLQRTIRSIDDDTGGTCGGSTHERGTVRYPSKPAPRDACADDDGTGPGIHHGVIGRRGSRDHPGMPRRRGRTRDRSPRRHDRFSCNHRGHAAPARRGWHSGAVTRRERSPDRCGYLSPGLRRKARTGAMAPPRRARLGR